MGVTTESVEVECTASTLRAVLCYINSGQTSDIAFDKDEFVQPLITKVKEAVADLAGSREVIIHFSEGEAELRRQFIGVCNNIESIMSDVAFCSEHGRWVKHTE